MLKATEIDFFVRFIRQGVTQAQRCGSAPLPALHWIEALIGTTSTNSEGPVFAVCTRAW
jgi:hypothetical protein